MSAPTAARDDRCGTYAGWQVHQKTGDPPCADCLVAHRDYMRAYRAGNKSYRTQNAARSRALWRLADLYPNTYRRLYLQEIYAAGAQPSTDQTGAST